MYLKFTNMLINQYKIVKKEKAYFKSYRFVAVFT